MKADIRGAVAALEFAIQVEQNGYRFYREAASKTEDPKGKELFDSLAEDEIIHESILKTRLKALKRDGEWKAIADRERPSESALAEGEPIFSRERIAEGVGDYTSELSALRLAYLIEKDFVDFYTQAAKETEDPVGKAMYEELADWERSHQRILEQEYRFLADQFKLDMGFAPF